MRVLNHCVFTKSCLGIVEMYPQSIPLLGVHFSLDSLFFFSFAHPIEFAEFVPSVTSMWSATSGLHETPDSDALRISKNVTFDFKNEIYSQGVKI